MENFYESTNLSLTENRNLINNNGVDISVVSLVWGEEYQLFIRIMIVITSFVAVTGIVVNVINIRTFYILGLNDGITVSLFALSISDMCFLFSYSWLRVFSVVIILEEEGVVWLSRVDPSVISTYIAALTVMSSTMGMFGVTFLAVARCLCVSMPLRFKNLFTTSRCVAFFLAFVVVTLTGYVPLLSKTGVQQALDPRNNRTRTVVWLISGREKIKDTVWLALDLISPLLVEVTLVVCALVMTRKLQESSKFRQAQHQSSISSSSRSGGGKDGAKGKETKLSQRDRRVVLQVLLISVIYIVANVPKIFSSLYTQIEAEFTYGGKLQNLFFTTSDIRFVFECINCTANFFVYYKFNSAFRAACFKSTATTTKSAVKL